MGKSEMTLSVPESTSQEFSESIAELIIPKMMAHPEDQIFQVFAKTEERITFRNFLQKSVEVSEGLIKFGLQPGDVVVFACPSNIKSNTAAVGIIFSTGIFAPIDPNWKPFEMQHFLRILQPKYIVCESAKAKEIKENVKSVNLYSKIIVIDNSQVSDSEFVNLDDIRVNVDLDNYIPRKVTDPKKDVVIISPSSGSTGLPKGVALSHYSVILNLPANQDIEELDWKQSLLLLSPLFWITGVIITLNAAMAGQLLYIPKSSRTEDVLEGIQKYKPNQVFFSPSILLFLIEHPDFKKCDISSVKIVVCGGSILGPAIAEKAKAAWKNAVILQAYGMTEVGGGITMPVPFDDPTSVGKLISNVKMKVVDVNTGESLGPNKVGECRIKTEKIMIGYYNNEEATKAAFDEDGWLRTGDLVYYNDKGLIYIVGRIKEIIKYQNHQISPTEIESFLSALPGVKDVAVVPIPHPQDIYHVKALVVKYPWSDITAEDIIQSVKENFSDSKHLRGGVNFVDVLPRTETGKLKRTEVQKLGEMD